MDQGLSLIALLKNVSYVATFFATVTWLGLDTTAVSMLALLLVLDFFTGIIRAALVDGAHTITSNEGIRGMAAKALVIIIPFVLAIVGKTAGTDLSPVAGSTLFVFSLSTAYSIIGNVHSLSTGRAKNEIDAIDWIYQMVGKQLERVIPKGK